ncbi:hypothetical protein BJV77DRAFT_1022070 [Russula vinacea]|nr:hypothetical protein BJV77DRAFT_1022070 [Russula vinacea]
MSTQDTAKTTETGNRSDYCATRNCGHHYDHHVTSANACTVQGCTCPKFVGEDPYCIRAGCSHGYQQHDPR